MTDGQAVLFNKPLIKESLQHLPAALEFPATKDFVTYLERHLHFNSENTRRRFALYIAKRFSIDGRMNLDLAGALKKFGGSRAAIEIFYFELCMAVPVLREVASLWLSEQPPTGFSRASLLAFLSSRVDSGGTRAETVARSVLEAFKGCRKITVLKSSTYAPLWMEPPFEAFLYVLARLYPDSAMVRVDQLAMQPAVRALLWPRPALAGLLEEANRAGHVGRISQLDQYYQFTLPDPASVRMFRLLQGSGVVGAREPRVHYNAPTMSDAPTALAASAADKKASAGKPRRTPSRSSTGRRDV